MTLEELREKAKSCFDQIDCSLTAASESRNLGAAKFHLGVAWWCSVLLAREIRATDPKEEDLPRALAAREACAP